MDRKCAQTVIKSGHLSKMTLPVLPRDIWEAEGQRLCQILIAPTCQITSETSGISEIPPLDLDKSGISGVSNVV